MREIVSTCVVIAGTVLAAQSYAQEWEYISYNIITGKASSPGYLKLSEPAPGTYKAKLMFPNPDICFRSDLAATSVTEADRQIITLAPSMNGCPDVRFVLKADGSSGKREVRQPDGSWKWDNTERGLKRK
jgi:hypothetical protein